MLERDLPVAIFPSSYCVQTGFGQPVVLESLTYQTGTVHFSLQSHLRPAYEGAYVLEINYHRLQAARINCRAWSGRVSTLIRSVIGCPKLSGMLVMTADNTQSYWSKTRPRRFYVIDTFSDSILTTQEH